ncbi:hypothetical protein RRG08_020849 [Elysia crispata]|uniref:Uncharacterized protein n=1 Tax=Elysia crispata TaxID=231223 RepID=A0AAE1CMU7_9GAST|nr:hypothetical protein RRG08_020849 [Elysia crispata]
MSCALQLHQPQLKLEILLDSAKGKGSSPDVPARDSNLKPPAWKSRALSTELSNDETCCFNQSSPLTRLFLPGYHRFYLITGQDFTPSNLRRYLISRLLLRWCLTVYRLNDYT